MNWDYTNESKSASYPKFDSFKVRLGTLREIKRYFRTVSRNILEYIVLFPGKKIFKKCSQAHLDAQYNFVHLHMLF